MSNTATCKHGYTWYCPHYCAETFPKQTYGQDSWRECAACFDFMAGKKKEPCPEHKPKEVNV